MSEISAKNSPDPGRPGEPIPPARPYSVRDVMILVFVVAALVRLGMSAGPGVVVLLLVVFGLSAVGGGIALLVGGRSIRSEPMLRVLSLAVERGLPVEPAIEACGAVSGGRLRRRSRAIVGLMERGVPLGEAFARVPGTIPRTSLAYLRMGWDGPELGRALRSLGERRDESKPFRDLMRSRIVFLVWTLLAVQVLMLWLGYWIAPKYAAIASDMGVDLPWLTRLTFAWTEDPRVVAAIAGLLPLQVLALPLVLLVVRDPLAWNIRPIDALLRKRHGATVLRLLAGEVARSRPMPESLERVAGAHPSKDVRVRLRRAVARVERGQPWADAIAGVGLIRASDAAVLDAAQRVGNLGWALEGLADASDRRSSFRLAAVGQVLYPVAAIMVALPVLIFVLAYFMPLVRLIQEMSL